jgi:hypothetical protein
MGYDEVANIAGIATTAGPGVRNEPVLAECPSSSTAELGGKADIESSNRQRSAWA